MRTFSCTAVTVLGLLAAAPAAHAQVGFGIAAGPTLPTGNLAEFVDPGLHGGVVLDVGIPLFPISFRADATFQQLPGISGLPDFRQWSGTLNGRLGLLPIPLLSLYLIGGVGLYSSDYMADQGTQIVAQTVADGASRDFGYNVGVGGRVNLLVVKPFLEARYHQVTQRNTRAFVPVTVGITF